MNKIDPGDVWVMLMVTVVSLVILYGIGSSCQSEIHSKCFDQTKDKACWGLK